MIYQTAVKSKENGNEERLLLKNNQLIVDKATNNGNESSTVETKEIFDLEFVYGVFFEIEERLLKIDLIEKEQQDKKANSGEATLTNIRPQDEKWNLRTLHFLEIDAAVKDQQGQQEQQNVTLAAFSEKLQKSALPRKNQLANTTVFVILNPTSGQRLANTYWKSIVKPMLITAGFDESKITKIDSERDGGTRKLAEALGQRISTLTNPGDPAPIVISMGGDGTLHETINGLKDASEGKGVAHFRLGVIPAGSGNSFALGLNIENVEQATLKIIKGQKEEQFYLMDAKFGHSINGEKWQDSIQYDDTKKPIRLLVVMSWGFHAQIVSKSRYLRYFMGNKRFSLVAMFLLKFLQQYEGELILKNAKKYNPELSAFDKAQEEVVLDSTTKGFTYFIASKQHSLEKGFKIAPFASSLTDDIDIVLLRGANAETLTNASINAFQGGAHVESNHVEYFKTTDLLLRVKHKAELCLDGEIHDLPANGILHLKVIGSSSTESTFTVFV